MLTNGKRWCPAPPHLRHEAAITADAVLGVWLAAGEAVEWLTTLLPSGELAVTGYRITSAKDGLAESEEPELEAGKG